MRLPPFLIALLLVLLAMGGAHVLSEVRPAWVFHPAIGPVLLGMSFVGLMLALLARRLDRRHRAARSETPPKDPS